jgi:drug/metabolite transporter (DMT)-like permease
MNELDTGLSRCDGMLARMTASARSGPISTGSFLCLLGGGIAIAFAPILVRLSETGPVASAFWRMLLAAPLLWMWAAYMPDSEEKTRTPWGAIIAAGVFFAGDLGVWHWSIIYTSIANSTLLVNLTPVFVTLTGWLLWRQRVTRAFLVAMVIAILGMFVLVGPNFAVGGTKLLGDAFAVIAAVSYAGYLVTIKVARDAKASTAKIMAWSTTITGVVLLPVALFSPQPFLPESAYGWWVLAGLALVTQVLGQTLIAYAFAHLPASLSSLSLLIQPVAAVIFAWLLLGEAVSSLQLLGGVIVLAGIWLAHRSS